METDALGSKSSIFLFQVMGLPFYLKCHHIILYFLLEEGKWIQMGSESEWSTGQFGWYRARCSLDLKDATTFLGLGFANIEKQERHGDVRGRVWIPDDQVTNSKR